MPRDLVPRARLPFIAGLMPAEGSIAVVVRHARPSDLGDRALSGPEGVYDSQLRRFLDMAGAGHGALLVAQAGRRLVGRVAVARGQDEATVSGLVVDARHRRRGVARTLMTAAEDWAAGHGCRRLRLTVAKTNVPAQRLYAKLGYRRVGAARSPGLVAADGKVVHPPEPVWVLARGLPAETTLARGLAPDTAPTRDLPADSAAERDHHRRT